MNAPVPSIPNSDDIANGSNPLPVLNPEDANDDGSGVRNTPTPVAENNINIKDEVCPVGKPEGAPVPSVPNSDKIANGSNDPPKGNGDGSGLSNAPPPPPVTENNINNEVRPVGKPQDAPVPSILNPDEIVNGSNDPPKGNGDGSGLSNAPPPPPAENNINDEVCPVGKPEGALVPSIPNSDKIANGSNDPPKGNGDGSGLSNAPPPPPVTENNINNEVRPVGKPQDAPVPSVLNPDEIVNGSNDPPKGNGDGSGLSNAPPPLPAENNINDEVCPVGKPQDAPVPSIPNPDEIANGSNDPPKGNGDGSSLSNAPPPVPEKKINDEVPSIPNPEDIVKPKANSDSSGVNNPPPVADIKGDTSPDLMNNEAPKSDENISP